MSERYLIGLSYGIEAHNEESGQALGYRAKDCPACLRPRVAGHHGCACDDDEDWRED